MVAKFNCKTTHNVIEFQKEEDTLLISLENEGLNYEHVVLSKNDLFSLIGQLLRIQSEIKEEVNNG